jgi:release factor glutamine methyltransferase
MTAAAKRSEPAQTVAAAVAEISGRLAAAGITDARREARLLVSHALGAGPELVVGRPERLLTADESDRIEALAALRAARRPMAQVLGRREFWSLSFEVTPATLDPRPDSECVVEAALSLVADRAAPLRIFDFGTGTGCLLLALLHELPAATGLGIDISPEACAVAKRNAAALGLAGRATFATGDWGRGIVGAFDLIVANPPYIPAAELAGLEPEVANFEPRSALDGGADGLDAYRALVTDLARLLTPSGHAVVEFGAGQGDAVAAVFRAQGLECTARVRDLAGRERALVLRHRRP